MDNPEQLIERRCEIEERLSELGSRTIEDKTVTWRVAETHWDVVLKELVWLSEDFSKERQRHISTAKKITKAVDQYHKTKEAKRARKIKEDQLALRRTASRIAKEASKFWLKVNKIIAFKQKSQADEARQQAMDKHLMFLVKQTERYTQVIADNMFGGIAEDDDDSQAREAHSDESDSSVSVSRSERSSKRGSKRKYKDAIQDSISASDMSDDDEFECESEPDDETTLMEAEKQEQHEYSDELALLKNESNMPIEQLRAMYATAAAAGSDIDDSEDVGESFDVVDADDESIEYNSDVEESDKDDADDVSDDDEFECESEPDDETTLMEAEKQEQHEYSDELALLKNESNMPIEQLRAMYAAAAAGSDTDDSEDVGESFDVVDDDDEVPSAHNSEVEEESDKDDADDVSDDDEFECESEPDDETTLMEAEKQEQHEYSDELALLKNESNMPIEQLRAMYATAAAGSDTDDSEGEGESSTQKSQDDMSMSDPSDDDDEFECESEPDDETTLMEAEKQEQHEYSDELALLKNESDMPIEQLRAMYSSTQIEDGTDEEIDQVEQESGVNAALRRLESADDRARSIRVDIPFVLSSKLTLREYQHVGLNWLVSLHERRLNGILADEMGLGKTIQTISLLAYLAVYRGFWGPHLIVVPTSVIINWETEIKRWCPIFKVLTYYGSAKARKALRTGWSKLNSFHICITSYQLVVQDSKAFRRKNWYYMILDEAHNIKNFKSQRWQTLLNFNTQRRLLLTGTPLQNNLMELWSLMHFLMPHLFRSRKEFSYWFSNPLSSMVEGNRSINNDLISRLHCIMRPFLLRRLKKDVAKQLPPKFEHIVLCKLSKRQNYLYEEFMSRSSTKQLLSGGNYMNMMNILMQLRKVCNHPDLFEPRPIVSPFVTEGIVMHTGSIFCTALAEATSNILCFWDYNVDVLCRNLRQQLYVSAADMIAFDDVNISTPPDVPDSLSSKKYSNIINEVRSIWLKLRKERSVKNATIADQRISRGYLPFNWRTAYVCGGIADSTPAAQALKWKCDGVANVDLPHCWSGLLVTVPERIASMDDMIRQFVFVLPKTTSPAPILVPSRVIHRKCDDMREIRTVLRSVLSPYYPCYIRQRIFFPDRKLVQFDSGKLQTLAVLLRQLKSGGHKCLIFTQMSKMLDILEIFLNLHAHTYVRLDGSTAIDRRQRLMDRFNNDPKLFCFILSTRSGGLGINLVGADTVIFFDSDWNPAMDAQAQDRAHRIGQTREVHIYRLVCQSTVEENILTKAKQKRHLDHLVMSEGNFTESLLFSSSNLRDMLGAPQDDGSTVLTKDKQLSQGELNAAMAAAEDDEDISALRGAEAEAVQENAEFDENAPIPTEEDDEDRPTSSTALVSNKDSAGDEVDAEFASWQASLGSNDFSAIENALKPIEKFAIAYRSNIEPYYSVHYLTEQQRLEEILNDEESQKWDIETIEIEKEEAEQRALADGELLASGQLSASEIQQLKKWYLEQRRARFTERRRRKMTGEGWQHTVDEPTGIPFWYNVDTGEACYGQPKVLKDREVYETAMLRKFNGIPVKVMVHVLEFLTPFPDRIACAPVCARWHEATKDHSFDKCVLSVETGVQDVGEEAVNLGANNYASVESCVRSSLPGDTIVLANGHHWESALVIPHPLRFVGCIDEPSRCVLEVSEGFLIGEGAKYVVLEGITVRRSRRSTVATSLDERSDGSALYLTSHSSLRMNGCVVSGGTRAGIISCAGDVVAFNTNVSNNAGHGIMVLGGSAILEDCRLFGNDKYALVALNGGVIGLSYCEVKGDGVGEVFCEDGALVRSRGSIRDKSEAKEGTKPYTAFDKDFPWMNDAGVTTVTSTTSCTAELSQIDSTVKPPLPTTDSAKSRGAKRKSHGGTVGDPELKREKIENALPTPALSYHYPLHDSHLAAGSPNYTLPPPPVYHVPYDNSFLNNIGLLSSSGTQFQSMYHDQNGHSLGDMHLPSIASSLGNKLHQNQ